MKVKVTIDLKQEGEEKLGYVLVSENPKAYTTPENDLLFQDSITIEECDDGLLDTISFKKLSEDHNWLIKKYFKPGDEVESIHSCDSHFGVAMKTVGIILSIPNKSGWDVVKEVILQKGSQWWIQPDFEDDFIKAGKNPTPMTISGIKLISTYNGNM